MDKNKTITVAGGCFWGVEEYYKRLKGIISTEVGYANGLGENVTYREVCTGLTGHAEVTQLNYDSDVITLNKILDHLFRMIDPTSLNRQGNDIGTQYRTGVYYTNQQDQEIIEEFINSKKSEYEKNIVVEIAPLMNFVKAELEHQDYLEVNPGGYCHVDFSTIKPEEMKESVRLRFNK